MRIGLFDSGVGGFTVLNEMLKRTSADEIIYVADTLRAPYGVKSGEVLVDFAAEVIGFLVWEGVDVIVSACNTLDTVVKTSRMNIPVEYLSIVDSAVEMVQSSRVAILATDFTVKSGIYKRLMLGKEVYQRSAQLLVAVAESGIKYGRMLEAIVRNYTLPLSRWMPEELVLGCTHFPIYEREFRAFLPGVRIIDPARRVVSKLPGSASGSGIVTFYVTGDLRDFERRIRAFGLHKKTYYTLKRLDLDVLKRRKIVLEEDNGYIGAVWSG